MFPPVVYSENRNFSINVVLETCYKNYIHNRSLQRKKFKKSKKCMNDFGEHFFSAKEHVLFGIKNSLAIYHELQSTKTVFSERI